MTQEEKINVAELLKDCPKGMELDCTICNGVKFIELDKNPNYPIVVRANNGYEFSLTKYGQVHNIDDAKCIIFPKGKTTWEGFVPPYEFKNGDIYYIKDMFGQEWVSIIKKCENNKLYTYVDIGISNNTFYCEASEGTCYCKDIIEHRLVTEDEKKKLFDAIKENGYRWNEETKTLEKLINKNKFVIGAIVTNGKIKGRICLRDGDSYVLEDGTHIFFNEVHNWELVSNKFDINTLKPFDKVLVRHNIDNKWCSSFFSHIDSNFHSNCYKYVTVAGKSYPMCIPYEGNEHLSGAVNNCIEYYKTW